MPVLLIGATVGRLVGLFCAFLASKGKSRYGSRLRLQNARDLLEEGAQLSIHDPQVVEAQISRDLKLEPASAADGLSGTGSWAQATSIEAAVRGADAVLVLTEWQDYRQLNWSELAALMRRPAWVFDARAVVDPVRTLFRLRLRDRSAPWPRRRSSFAHSPRWQEKRERAAQSSRSDRE